MSPDNRSLEVVKTLKWKIVKLGQKYTKVASHKCSWCGAISFALKELRREGGQMCTCDRSLPTSHTWFADTMFKELKS